MATEARKPSAIREPRSRRASGRIKIGFRLLISAKTGIGSGRAAAVSNRDRPAVLEPVKPTARVMGWLTNAKPIILPLPWSIENTPRGRLQAVTALQIAAATNSEVPG